MRINTPLQPTNIKEKPFEVQDAAKDPYDLDCRIQEVVQGQKDGGHDVPSGCYHCNHTVTCTCNNGHGC